MARRRHRAEDRPRVSGFEPTASPTRPPTCAVYLLKGDDPGSERLYIENFRQPEYARVFIRAALEGEGETKWLKNSFGRLEIRTESGVRLRASDTDELEMLMEIEPDDSLELPVMIMRQLAAWKEGRGMRAQKSDGTEIEPKEPKEKRKRAPKGERVEKVKKEKPAGMKGVPELCAELGKEGGDIRAALRKLYTKPDIGWLWPEAEFPAIVKAVKKAVK